MTPQFITNEVSIVRTSGDNGHDMANDSDSYRF